MFEIGTPGLACMTSFLSDFDSMGKSKYHRKLIAILWIIVVIKRSERYRNDCATCMSCTYLRCRERSQSRASDVGLVTCIFSTY